MVSGIALAAAPSQYDVAFSTYLGGNNFDAIRGVAVDHQGNIVVVGGTASPDFPVTAGAYQQKLSPAGPTCGRLGATDAFIAKFTPRGQLIWSTYLGGPGYDRAYAVEVDQQDRIIVAGRAGEGFPTTKSAFQPNFIDTFPSTGDVSKAEYGKQNGFVSVFTTDGAMVWSSYVWYGQLCRDVAVDDAGDLYLPSGWNGNIYAPNPPPPDLSGFKKKPNLPLDAGRSNTGNLGAGDNCVLKVKGDGSRILWGTWLSGSRDDSQEAMVRVDADRNVFYANFTHSEDNPINLKDRGIHTHAADGGKDDMYLAKISADGNTLVYSTYIGGDSFDELDTHQLAVDRQGNAYLDFSSKSTNLPTTPGTMMPKYPAGSQEPLDYLCKIGPDGALLLGTYLPATTYQIPEGLSVDAEGNVYMTGSAHSPDMPVTEHAFQKVRGEETYDYMAPAVTASKSGFFTVVAADFKSLIYSTYFGKGCSLVHYNSDGTIKHYNAYGGFNSSVLAPDGSFVAVGSWHSPGLPLSNAWQEKYHGGPARGVNDCVRECDAIITRFVPVFPNAGNLKSP